MSMAHSLIVASAVALIAVSAQAEQIPAGNWKQTSSNMGDCSTCEVGVTRVSPDIIQINGNNGWVGYLHYIKSEDRYSGAMQWKAGKGGAYENMLFITDGAYEGKTLSLNAKSGSTNMMQTYRAK